MDSSKEWTIHYLIEYLSTYMDDVQIKQIKQAYTYAKKMHSGQTRKSGIEYIVHPVQVAAILARLKMDKETIEAGFLHDVVEDTPATLTDIKNNFGTDVAEIVDGVTKIGQVEYRSNQERLAANHRKLLLAMSHDIRVIIVKLADRLHNMRTLQFLSEEKQKQIANETLEIYAPLADRLGINTIKWELEDLSLRYLKPKEYYQIADSMKIKLKERVAIVNQAIDELKQLIDELNIQTEIYGRPKHIYSIYRKMQTKHKEFDQIYDLLALRVIVDNVKDCYDILGIVHTHWKPIPGRFKDYIAMPKANMYQSLHTTVIGPKGNPIEIQIRTKKMHEIAEYGIAAHWAYKQGQFNKVQFNDDENKLNWFKQIIEFQDMSNSDDEFMEGVKGDLFTDCVYAFTPKGDVIELPKGSSPLDMAYLIHTQVGNHTTGAKVNGKIVPLSYQIKTGDIVEIATSDKSYPKRDWLQIVHTRRAVNKIKRYFRKLDKENNIEYGKERLIQELKNNNYNVDEILTRDNLQKVVEKLSYNNIDDLFAAIGFGDINVISLVNRLTEEQRQKAKTVNDLNSEQEILNRSTDDNDDNKQEKEIVHGDVAVEGIDNVLVRLSNCCFPVPGDDIVGYITQGKGISVHRNDCSNLEQIDSSKLVNVSWNIRDKNALYTSYLQVRGFNRVGILNDVLRIVNNTTKMVDSVSGRVQQNKYVLISLLISIHNLEDLNRIITNLKNIPDVYEVERAIK